IIRRPPRSTQSRSSAASDVYKRQEKKQNISRNYQRTPAEVNEWINYLQTNIGTYARPRTAFKYPRVSISTVKAGRDLVAAMSSFFQGKPYTYDVKENIQESATHQN